MSDSYYAAIDKSTLMTLIGKAVDKNVKKETVMNIINEELKNVDPDLKNVAITNDENPIIPLVDHKITKRLLALKPKKGSIQELRADYRTDIIKGMFTNIDNLKQGIFIDYGAGDASITAQLSKKLLLNNVIAIEYKITPQNMKEMQKNLKNVENLNATIFDSSNGIFPSNVAYESVSLIMFSHTLHHIPGLDNVMNTIRPYLMNGAFLILREHDIPREKKISNNNIAVVIQHLLYNDTLERLDTKSAGDWDAFLAKYNFYRHSNYVFDTSKNDVTRNYYATYIFNSSNSRDYPKSPRDTASIASNYRGLSKYAYVSLLMRDGPGYIPGLIALNNSLAKSKTPYDFVLMITPDIDREVVSPYCTRIVEIEEINAPTINLKSEKQTAMYGSWISSSFSKFACLSLVEYDKVLFLDLDVIVLENMDSLFELNAPAGTFGWPTEKEKGGKKGLTNIYKHLKHGDIVPNQLIQQGLNGYHVAIASTMLLKPGLDDFKRFKQLIKAENKPFGLKTCISGFDEQAIALLYMEPPTSPTSVIQDMWSYIHPRYSMIPWHTATWNGAADDPESSKPAALWHYHGIKPWNMILTPEEAKRSGISVAKNADIALMSRGDWIATYSDVEKWWNYYSQPSSLDSVNFTQGLYARIICPIDGRGIEKDTFIMHELLRYHGIVAEIVFVGRDSQNSGTSRTSGASDGNEMPFINSEVDFNIFIERTFDEKINTTFSAKKSYLLVNQEFLTDWSINSIRRGELIPLFKTHFGMSEVQSYFLQKESSHKESSHKESKNLGMYIGFGNLKTLSAPEGQRAPEGPKLPFFLHIAGSSPLKGTVMTIKAYKSWKNASNKNIPLIITISKAKYPSLVEKYILSLSSRKSTLPFDLKSDSTVVKLSDSNIYICSGSDKYENILQLQSKALANVCLSAIEGYGHYIDEARRAGSIVITLNGGPMAELINSDIGVMVDAIKEHTFDSYWKNHIPYIPSDYREKITTFTARDIDIHAAFDRVAAMSEQTISKMSDAAVKTSINDAIQFRKTAAVNWLRPMKQLLQMHTSIIHDNQSLNESQSRTSRTSSSSQSRTSSHFSADIIDSSKKLNLPYDYSIFTKTTNSEFYSLLPFQLEQVSAIFTKYVPTSQSSMNLQSSTTSVNSINIIDGFSHIGVDLANIMRLYPSSNITAYEIDEKTCSILNDNVKKVKSAIASQNPTASQGKVDVKCETMIQILNKSDKSVNLIYLDPPFDAFVKPSVTSGTKAITSYKDVKDVTFEIEGHPLHDIVETLHKNYSNAVIIIKVPRNYDFSTILYNNIHFIHNEQGWVSFNLLIVKGDEKKVEKKEKSIARDPSRALDFSLLDTFYSITQLQPPQKPSELPAFKPNFKIKSKSSQIVESINTASIFAANKVPKLVDFENNTIYCDMACIDYNYNITRETNGQVYHTLDDVIHDESVTYRNAYVDVNTNNHHVNAYILKHRNEVAITPVYSDPFLRQDITVIITNGNYDTLINEWFKMFDYRKSNISQDVHIKGYLIFDLNEVISAEWLSIMQILSFMYHSSIIKPFSSNKLYFVVQQPRDVNHAFNMELYLTLKATVETRKSQTCIEKSEQMPLCDIHPKFAEFINNLVTAASNAPSVPYYNTSIWFSLTRLKRDLQFTLQRKYTEKKADTRFAFKDRSREQQQIQQSHGQSREQQQIQQTQRQQQSPRSRQLQQKQLPQTQTHQKEKENTSFELVKFIVSKNILTRGKMELFVISPLSSRDPSGVDHSDIILQLASRTEVASLRYYEENSEKRAMFEMNIKKYRERTTKYPLVKDIEEVTNLKSYLKNNSGASVANRILIVDDEYTKTPEYAAKNGISSSKFTGAIIIISNREMKGGNAITKNGVSVQIITA